MSDHTSLILLINVGPYLFLALLAALLIGATGWAKNQWRPKQPEPVREDYRDTCDWAREAPQRVVRKEFKGVVADLRPRGGFARRLVRRAPGAERVVHRLRRARTTAGRRP